MKKIIDRLWYSLYKLKTDIIWIFEALLIRCFYLIKETNKLELSGLSVILLPHVDDEWIGCSGVICNNKKGVVLCDMDMPGGDDQITHNKRKNELNRLSVLFNTPLEKCSDEDSLKFIIKKYNPKYIFVPYFIDWHNEHQLVITRLHNVLKELDKQILDNTLIMMYQVSVPIHPKVINITYNMSHKQWNYKWDMFVHIYPSQSHISYNRFRYNELVTGFHKSYAAEPYCSLPYAEWNRLYEKWRKTERSLLPIKDCLSNLILVRIKSRSLHTELWGHI